MRFTKQTPLKTLLEVTGPSISLVTNLPFKGALVESLEAYSAFLRGKGGQGGERAHHWEVNAALRGIFRKDAVIFDVGAAKGDWSATMLSKLPNARMFLVEPQPSSQALIAQRNLPNTILLSCALGASVGVATLYAPREAAVVASLYKRSDSRWEDLKYDEYEIPMSTLEDLAKKNDLDFIDFVKMDIEGHELSALHGATPLFKEAKVGALSFEFGPGNVNSRTMFIDFFELLSDFGFSVYRILPGGRLKSIPRYDEDCEYYRGTCNYTAKLIRHPFQSAGE